MTHPSPARCGSLNCTAHAHTRGYCEPHYRRRLKTRGEWGIVDPAEVLAHLAELRRHGWTWVQIGDAAGIAWSTPYGLWIGRYTRMRADSARALLAVPVTPARSHRGVDSCGTRRRVQALAWMGWPLAEVAKRADIPLTSLRSLIYRRISREYAARVAEVYDALSDTRGPSLVSAGIARKAGHLPPIAWDEDTIDDPGASPLAFDVDPPRSRVDLAEVEHLRRGGCSDEEIARRMGVRPATLRQAEWRAA